jgi:hypothetical protein
MQKTATSVLALMSTLIFCSWVFGQESSLRETRRPDASARPSSDWTRMPSNVYFSILDGSPMLLNLYHDTKVGTNKPIDIYDFVIELQVMNSDGNLEPIGLQVHNFYTAKPLDAKNDVNPNNASDCKKWYDIVSGEERHHNPKNKIWPYVEFKTAESARVIRTNEHGAVWWSDDVECWGSQDRFPPF